MAVCAKCGREMVSGRVYTCYAADLLGEKTEPDYNGVGPVWRTTSTFHVGSAVDAFICDSCVRKKRLSEVAVASVTIPLALVLAISFRFLGLLHLPWRFNEIFEFLFWLLVIASGLAFLGFFVTILRPKRNFGDELLQEVLRDKGVGPGGPSHYLTREQKGRMKPVNAPKTRMTFTQFLVIAVAVVVFVVLAVLLIRRADAPSGTRHPTRHRIVRSDTRPDSGPESGR